ncbi:MAG: prepilin-type N-terminal cleavage/methylation domain-containing protein [Synergistaceae bacterium]|nr:prepilin-type N-terminal cleavage/methylation domain-containing protein [Synergistaceae bacterium]
MISRRGFTLIEILVSVMLTGVLTTLALSPVVISVRRAVLAQEEYSDDAALSRTLNFIARDVFSAIRLAPEVLEVRDHEAMGSKADDALIVMTTAPTAQNYPASTVVYKISEGGMLHGGLLSGLYRWILPGRTLAEIDVDGLEIEDGQLILPGVTEFSAEIPVNSREDDRRKEYRGQLTSAIYLKIVRGAKSEERIITFP